MAGKVAWWSTQLSRHNPSTWQTHRQPHHYSKRCANTLCQAARTYNMWCTNQIIYDVCDLTDGNRNRDNLASSCLADSTIYILPAVINLTHTLQDTVPKKQENYRLTFCVSFSSWKRNWRTRFKPRDVSFFSTSCASVTDSCSCCNIQDFNYNNNIGVVELTSDDTATNTLMLLSDS